MNIEELRITELEKDVLKEMIEPHTIATVAAKLDNAYSTASSKLKVWEAKGWIRKIRKGSASIYFLNQDEIELKSEEVD